MSAKSESGLQRRVQRALRAAFPNAYVRKIHGSAFTPAGMPDLICCIKGLFIGIEVKMPGEKPTALQANEQDEIWMAGGIAMIVHSPEEAVKLCHAWLGKRA